MSLRNFEILRSKTGLGQLIARYPFLSKVLLLASGTLLGQAVLIGSLPILTRIYSVESMGLLGVAMTAAMVAATPACLRLELAIPLPRTATAGIQLLAAGILSATLIFCFLLGMVLIAPDFSTELVGNSAIQPYLAVIVISGWFLSLYSALQFWSIRQGRIREASTTQLSRSLGSVSLQIGLGLMGAGAGGLIFGFLGYCIIGCLGLLYVLFRNDRSILKRVRLSRLRWAIKKNRRYIAYSVPHSLLDILANSGPLLVIAAIVSEGEAGLLFLALRITSIPIGLIGGSLSRIYLADAAERRAMGELQIFTRQIMGNLAKIGIVVFIPLMFLAPLVFPIIFGDEWARSGYMTALLVPALYLQLICSPVSTVFVVQDRMDLAFLLQLLAFIVVMGAIFFAHAYAPDFVFEGFAVGMAIYYVAYLFATLYVSNDRA